MSRIGKKPILIPSGADIKIDGRRITIKGSRGELSREFRPEVSFSIEEGKIVVRGGEAPALWGTTRAIIANMVKGVTDGYEKRLEIEGVGYKASIEGNDLVLIVGFSHPVKIVCPDGIKLSVDKNVISVTGVNKELVGQTAARIRAARPPEPYKGKGIRYQGEHIRRKLGKKAVATTK